MGNNKEIKIGSRFQVPGFNPVLEKCILAGIKFGVFFILLTPLVVWPDFPFPAGFPKAIYFRSLVEIIFAFYLLLLALNIRKFSFKKYLPKPSLALIALLIFFEVEFLASLQGINFYRSFWGTIERMEGLILHLHLLAFFVVLAGVFKNSKDWRRFFWILAVAAILAAGGAIIERLGIFHFWGFKSQRISSTLGNPDFLSSFMVASVFLTIFLLNVELKRLYGKFFKIIPYFLGGLIILFTVALLLTLSRGGVLGLFSGAATFCVLLWIFSLDKQKRLKFGIAVILLGITFLYIAATPTNILTKSRFYILQTIPSIFRALNYESLRDRFSVWRVAWGAFQERPVFGWGLESFNYIYDRDFRPTDPRYFQNEKVAFDRSHNKIFDLLAETGAMGLLAYLFLFFAIFRAIFLGRKEIGLLPSFSLAGFFSAYFGQNLFVFDHLSSYLVFFLILAFLASQSENRKTNNLTKNSPPIDTNRKLINAKNY